jgi:hypothetical protein
MKTDFSARALTTLEWICRLALAGLFLYAALPKLADPAAFAKAITNYKVSFPLIGQNYVYPAAIFLPALELIAGLGLLYHKTKHAAGAVATVLLSVFTILILQAVLRGFNIDCGCFGTSDLAAAKAHKVGWSRLLQNLGWIIAAAYVWRRSARKKPSYRL